MPSYQYLIMLVLIFYHYKASKGAFVIFLGYVFFGLIVYIDIPAEDYSYYYVCTSFACLVVGYFLQRVNVFAAICSYSLVFVNVYGFFLWYNYLEHVSYDNICMFILLLQLLLVTPRSFLDGLRYYIQHYAPSSNVFDSLESCDKIYKNQTTKKTDR